MLYRILSDLVVVLHFLWIVFIILGFALTGWYFFLGYVLKRSSEKADRFFDRWLFRTLHLLGIGFVAAQTLLGKYCPLTVLENYLRAGYAPEAVYPGSFIIYYLEQVVYPRVHPAVIVIPTIVLAVFTMVVFILRPPEKIREVLQFSSKKK